MKYLQPLRLATYLLLLFAFGHTRGGMFTHLDAGPAAETVWQGMQNVHFIFMNQDTSYYDQWLGFGLTATVFLLLSAALAWGLAGLEPKLRNKVGFVLWLLALSQVANAYLAFRYFFPAPGVFSVVLTGLFGYQAWRDRSA